MKKTLPILCLAMIATCLTGCNNNHEHTFSNEYSSDETSHWRDATCGCTDLTKDRGAHIDTDNDGKCDVCHHSMPIVVNKYIVSFVTNSETTIDPISVNEGEAFVKPTDPVKSECVFMGWYLTSDCSGEPYVFGTRVTKDITLYALWGAEITFINPDGSIFLTNRVRLNETVSKPQNPEYLDAHFMGWYDNRDFEGDEFNFNTPLTKNTKLYAQFGYKITYLGYDKSIYLTETIPLGTRVTKPSDPTYDYYDFDAWYLDEAFLEKYEFNDVLINDITLFSKFTPKKYAITYHNAEGLIHSNPSNYSYGVGVSNFEDPTGDELNYKFYGWYLDENYSVPATSISAEKHEPVDIYAKRAEQYSISYVNWPDGIDNPNPLTYTEFDQFLIDITNITSVPGFLDVSFTINGESIPGVSFGTKGNLVVNISYKLYKTNLTIDPNEGSLLPENTYINASFGIEGEDPVRVAVPNKNQEQAANIYDPLILNIPTKNRKYFNGFSYSPLSKLPLDETEINNIPNGKTIYAMYEDLPTGTYSLPAQGSSMSGGEINRNFYVPKNVGTITLDFVTSKVARGEVRLYGYGDGVEPESVYSGAVSDYAFDIHTIELPVSKYTYLSLLFTYVVDQEEPAYSYSLNVASCNSLLVKCDASEEIVNYEISYSDIFSIADPIREGHTFVGWYDEEGNKIEKDSPWLITDSSVTLTAHYKYNDLDSFKTKLEETYNSFSSALTGLEYLDSDEKLSIDSNLYYNMITYSGLLDGDLDYKQADQICSNGQDAMARIYYHAEETNLGNAKEHYTDRLSAYERSLIELSRVHLDEVTLQAMKNEMDEVLVSANEDISNASNVDRVIEIHDLAKSKLDEIYYLYL